MRVTVIIPTYNEADVLQDCIESLGTQTFKDFEIVVVDDGSTDSTLNMLSGASKTLPSFKFFEQKHLGAGAARNLGAKHAKGDILVFVDADMTFDDFFIAKLVEPIESRKTKGTFSKEESVSNWSNIWARCWNINEGWEDGKRHPKSYPDSQPVFRAILKDEFNKVGGFTPGGYDDDWSLSKKLGYMAINYNNLKIFKSLRSQRFYDDDWSLSKKLGYMAINAPSAVFYHKNPSSLVEIFNHAKWVGKRKYKLGAIGDFIALIRSSLPVSICVGLYKSILNLTPAFIIFKIIYDFGIFIGILELLVNKRYSK